MCGIAGVASSLPGARLGSSIAGALRHRGPDGEDFRACVGESFSWEVAHTRLAIVDLSPAGRQPVANEDGSLVMVFNGEIYNSPELRTWCEARGHHFVSSMDGEVILHLWEIEGIHALARLNGIFAVALANTVTGEVVLARDPVGVKPLVYSVGPGSDLWFASELNALVASGAPVGSPDIEALGQFLTFLWVPDPKTPYRGGRSLQPGHALRWTPSGAALMRYTDPLVPASEGVGLRREEGVQQCRERFRAAAQRQLMADVPIGLMASGGVDSGLLWWATRDSLNHGYTIGWGDRRGGEGLSDDAVAVAQLERRFGTPVTRLAGEDAETELLPQSGDLFADPAYDLTRLIARKAREDGFKVLLAGQGGDELFAGYRRHTMAPLIERLRLGHVGRLAERMLSRLPPGHVWAEYLARLARASAEGDPFRGYMQLCSYSTAAERARVLGCYESDVSDDVVWQRHQEVYDRLPRNLSFLRKVMAVDLAVYLPGLNLAYADRGGMEFGVEIRVPWLDLDLVRWSLTLPDDLLMRRRRGKWLTRELAARELSPKIAHRPKRGFAAPAGRVRPQGAEAGERGFRQGSYFARAVKILDAHLANGGTTVPRKAG